MAAIFYFQNDCHFFFWGGGGETYSWRSKPLLSKNQLFLEILRRSISWNERLLCNILHIFMWSPKKMSFCIIIMIAAIWTPSWIYWFPQGRQWATKRIRNQEGITYQYHTKHFLYTADPRSSPWLPDYKECGVLAVSFFQQESKDRKKRYWFLESPSSMPSVLSCQLPWRNSAALFY